MVRGYPSAVRDPDAWPTVTSWPSHRVHMSGFRLINLLFCVPFSSCVFDIDDTNRTVYHKWIEIKIYTAGATGSSATSIMLLNFAVDCSRRCR